MAGRRFGRATAPPTTGRRPRADFRTPQGSGQRKGIHASGFKRENRRIEVGLYRIEVASISCWCLRVADSRKTAEKRGGFGCGCRWHGLCNQALST